MIIIQLYAIRHTPYARALSLQAHRQAITIGNIQYSIGQYSIGNLAIGQLGNRLAIAFN